MCGDRARPVGCAIIAREMLDTPELDTTQSETAPPQDEPRGCLFALSQPPLMIFLAVIGSLLLMAALHDLLLL
ncbi:MULTISPECIES: hypothetical protein [Streptomyces]|uniref:Uncharacterized protein n=3 Tax=Streptomyces TaxID=1883 RepID=A0A2U9NXH2_STRAS|nr:MULTISPECIES: hypothetical protein [Streptomyces]AWT42022.1 hypothetical protein DMT42_06655 [Streptomyces actuosus]MBM4825362.1 hypothetical protein [Streptomyces actuosus]GHF83200.1 hypothetical protein GCM10018783_62050 [Streptomyces griseosporeus]